MLQVINVAPYRVDGKLLSQVTNVMRIFKPVNQICLDSI